MRRRTRTMRLIGLGMLLAAAIGAYAVFRPAQQPARAAGGSVSLGKTVDVTADQFADNEESAGMSPDGSLLAAAWNDFDFNDGCGFSFSTNGGKLWAPRSFVPGFTNFTNNPSIPGTGTFAVAGDPAVAYNPRFHTFDVVCQAFGATGGAINLLATTFDPTKADPTANENASYVGASNPWTRPVAVTTGISNGTQKGSNGQFPDHEAITVDTATGPGHHFGRLYVAWAEFNGSGRSPINLAFSDDNGATWTGPVTVSDANHKFDQDAHTVIAPNGTVYVTFSGGPNETSLSNNFVGLAASTDGGRTFGPTVEVAPMVDPVPGLLPNSNYRVFSDVISAVSSNGVVTVVWNDERTGHSNLYAVHNLTAGDVQHWSAPVAIKPSVKEEFFPWLVAAPSGRLDLTFYDRSGDPADTLNAVDYGASFDNGASWATLAATPTTFDGDKFQACLAFVQSSTCGTFFIGDYIAIVSTDSTVHLLYTANGPNAMDVFDTHLTY
jgi:hypothetical protein